MSIFELLTKTDLTEAKELLYREGKKKAYCPIRFFTKEQIEEYKTNKCEKEDN